MGDTYKTAPREALLGEEELCQLESCGFAVLFTAVRLGRRRRALLQGVMEVADSWEAGTALWRWAVGGKDAR